MQDKHSKKVIIINDINSDAIERAILILREGKISVPSPAAGSHIVEEAQTVINSYIRTMDKAQYNMERKEHRCRNTHSSPARIGLWTAFFASLVVLGYILLHFSGIC